MPGNTIPRPPAGDEGNAPRVLGSPWLTDEPPENVAQDAADE